ncbi:PQQ-dependent sugar dehydrogenase [bacterium]|nr:PQQ-dependent sugar dehydrogenase [bacterium]
MLMAPPDDNPFVDIPGAAAAVWSYGHRNPQGLTVNAQTGELWSHEHEDLEPPVHYWEPSIAPSDMLFYDGDAFPGWRGNLFVGTLAGRHISRLVHDGTKVISEEQLLADPHGSLYFGVDAGDILRLVPVKR